MSLNSRYRAPLKKDRHVGIGAMQRRAARINVRAGCAYARARARDDNYHALPSTSNLWRSTRATASLLWGKKKQESGVRRAKGDAERENKNAPVLTSRHNTPRIYVYSPCTRSLYRHDDFTNIRLHPGPLFLLGLTSPPPTVSLPFSLRALCNANLAQ